MNKILTSAGLAAIGAVSLQAATPLDRTYYAPNPSLSSQERSKMWSVSASLRGFYDDNYLTAPSATAKDSFGFEFSPRVALNAALEQTFIGVSYQYSLRWYADREGKQYDQGHQADLNLTHSFSDSLKLEMKDSMVYSQEPEVLSTGVITAPLRSELSNLRNLADISMHADISRLFSTTFGYANTLYDYGQSGAGSYSATLDRMEHLIKIDLRWNVQPTTIALLGYMYGIIDHTSNDSLIPYDPLKTLPGSDPAIRDARSHYIFAGFDQTFANQLLFSLRGGAQITDYPNALPGTDDNVVSPYGDISLSYGYAQGSSLQVGFRHALNQTDIAYVSSTDTSATFDQETSTVYAMLTHEITAKLSARLLGQFQYSTFNGGKDALGNDYNQKDKLYLFGFSLNYQFNPYWGAEMGYNYDHLNSDYPGREFSRNRVFLGLRASY